METEAWWTPSGKDRKMVRVCVEKWIPYSVRRQNGRDKNSWKAEWYDDIDWMKSNDVEYEYEEKSLWYYIGVIGALACLKRQSTQEVLTISNKQNCVQWRIPREATRRNHNIWVWIFFRLNFLCNTSNASNWSSLSMQGSGFMATKIVNIWNFW